MSRGPWIEALEVQAGLIDRLLRPGSGLHKVTRAFESTIPERERAKAAWRAPDGTITPLDMTQWVAANLVHADTYWVSAEMLDVTEHAAESLDLTEPGGPEDLPVPAGFALLERSVRSWDVRGRVVTFRAVSWSRVPPGAISHPVDRVPEDEDIPEWDQGGVVFTLWVDTTDPDDEVNQELSARGLLQKVGGGRYQIQHVGQIPFGRDLAEWLSHARQSEIATDKQGRGPVSPEERVRLGEQQTAWLRTFWRLIEQRVGYQAAAKPDRAAARRLARVTERLPESVTVVTLRRYAEDQPPVEGEPGEVKWSHRWMVRGHWRNQWYASLGRHRQIWIAPFVKGPDDQPLVLKPKVHRWTR